MADKALIHKLIEKLKVGDGRNIHVNAMPNSVSKIDIFDLANIEPSLHLSFLKDLLSKKNFEFNFSLSAKIIAEKKSEDKQLLRELGRKLNYLYYQNIDEYEEHGIKTFGLGYPLLIKRDKISGKIIKSPIFIWYLELKKDTSKSDAWIISRSEDNPMIVNEVLSSQLYQQDNIAWDDILPDDEELCTEAIISDFCVQLLKKFDIEMSDNDKIVKLMPCTTNESIDVLTADMPWIRWSGVLGQYKTQKQSIIQDLETLSKEEVDEMLAEHSYIEGMDLPVMPLDASQEGILDYLEHRNRIVVQGPPGTGKSQTLTAIIAHALLNQKNVLVVCEKKTAMDVLYNNLTALGLQEECLLIEDIFKDRKRVVASARRWLDDDQLAAPPFKEQDFNFSKAQYIAKKEELNFILNLPQQYVFGDDTLLELIIKVKKLEKEYPEQINIVNKPCDYADYLAKAQVVYESSKNFILLPFDENILTRNIFAAGSSKDIILQKYYDIYNKINILYNIIKTNTLQYGANFYSLRSINNFKLSIGALVSTSMRAAKHYQQDAVEQYRHLFPLLSSRSIIQSEFPNPETLQSLQELEVPLQGAVQALGNLMGDDIAFQKYVLFYCNIYRDNIYEEIQQLTNFSIERWQNIYSKSILKNIVNQYFTVNSVKEDTLQLLADFGVLEEKIKILSRQKIKHICFERRKTLLDKSDKAKLKYLYNLRKNKHYASRNSLRNIIQADMALFQAIFPVLMVNPAVCSSILPLKAGLYDVLIMDEASQLKLEDTYAALFRGKIHLISGDKHQMPPSGFFTAVLQHSKTDGELTDEQAITQYLADSKSLLEYAEDNNYFQHHLDFHYRSRNPQLIDFSNSSFYSGRLLPLPPKSPYTAITYQHIDGSYSDNVNAEEAEALVKYIFDTYADTEFSIGIATFNLLQRNLVWNTLWEKAYESEQNMKILEAHIQRGLFVKNLENIQGDERDVILLSTTFGKDENGKFRQNFGPLTTQKGYQLLNVIITRAKHFMHVVSSILLPDANILEESLKSNQYAGKDLVYAYLYYAKAISNNDDVTVRWILDIMKQNSAQLNNNNNEINSLIKDIYTIENEQYKEYNINFGGYVLDLKSEDRAWDVGIRNNHILPTRAYRNILHKRNVLKEYSIQYNPFLMYAWWTDKS